MMKFVLVGLLSAMAYGSGPEVVLVNTDHEDLPEVLTFPPYMHSRGLWGSSGDGSWCCEGPDHFVGVRVDVPSVSGTHALADRVSYEGANGTGFSSSIRIPIPSKYQPLEKATLRAWVYIDQLSGSWINGDSGGFGFVVLGVWQNQNVGVMWDHNTIVKAHHEAHEVEPMGTYNFGGWEKWKIDYDFVHRTYTISRGDNLVGTYNFAPDLVDQPALFIFNSAIGMPNGWGSGTNESYYDDVYASVTPLCDPAEGDCNNNGIADRCDINPDLGGTIADCNINLVPDDCEADCDADGVPDDCDNDECDRDNDGTPDVDDGCPDDPDKQAVGVCGCYVPDVNTDGDGKFDCQEICIDDPNKFDPGSCGCGVPDSDSDLDAVVDCVDECDVDPDKIVPGICGCNVADDDTDNDGTPDCNDNCPNDPNKIEPGIGGCEVSDVDTDGDGTIDANDGCPNDADKTEAGLAGCGGLYLDTCWFNIPLSF